MSPVRTMSSLPPSTPPGSGQAARVRIGDDGFVPEAALDAWQRVGEVVRAGAVACMRDGRRYVLQDALRVLGRRNGETDPYGFTGRDASLRDLVRQGSILSSDGLRLGAAVYDVEFGVLAFPLGGADESGTTPKLG